MDRFLADLSGRRQRLLELVSPPGQGASALIDELQELGEQLIVADEELRVQQEALDDARRQLDLLTGERRARLHGSAQAQVLTDNQGLVREANRAADQLIRRPSARTTPRPIVTWFDVADRPRVRSLIGRMAAGSSHETLARAAIKRSDAVTVPASVSVFLSVDPATGGGLLQWELVPIDEPLHALPDPGELDADYRLAADLATLVTELAALGTVDAALLAVCRAAVRLVPGAEQVALGYLGEAPSSRPRWTDQTVPAQLAALQCQDGPGAEVLSGALARVLVEDILAEGHRWPRWTAAGSQIGVRSVLSVALPFRTRARGALVIYAEAPGALDEESESVASSIAAQAAAAVARIVTEADLRRAIERRQVVGQAVGILVERHRLTPDAAFDRLATASNHRNLKVHDIAKVMMNTGQEPADVRPEDVARS
jgi:hypothetical protein